MNMRKIRCAFTALVVSFCLVTGGHSQSEQVDRQPAVAGQFYPGNKAELRASLEELFSKAVPSRGIRNVRAIISPHAGYVFSGITAASAFNQIDPAKDYDNIFVIGPSHHVGFEGASVYTQGNFITPLGVVKVNMKLGQQLVDKYPVFSSRADAHLAEHSIEVQLPFLQFKLKKDFRIVPIVVGAGYPETGDRTLAVYKKIAEALLPYFNEQNLFVISTDFSHYPSYDWAKIVDKATADAVVSNSVQNLVKTYDENAGRGVPNLVTSMCGLSGVLTFLYMTQDNTALSFDLIQYRNAGDAEVGDKNRVVGYCALAVSVKGTKEKQAFSLNEKEKQTLLALARKTVEQYVTNHSVPEVDPIQLSDHLKTNCGAFVTINKHGALRGCIGRFDAEEPLYKVVREMAVAAATQDYRFTPVERSELPELEIEISVLTPLKKIQSIDEIEMGKHGIYIKKGSQSGTFLPQVAKQTGWSKEEFLGHCAEEKAGIGWDGWKDADIYTYEALVFSEH
jgi:AmmeMemoRadiSam system protein B/AmmeMemoRadiSam system protein A